MARNFAQETIDGINTRFDEVQNESPDAVLRKFVILGTREILITEMRAHDNTNIEVKGLEGNQETVNLIPYHQIQITIRLNLLSLDEDRDDGYIH